MKGKKSVTRRGFVKSSAMASAGLLGISAPTGSGVELPRSVNQSGTYIKDTLKREGAVSGLLFSQVGYEPGMPVRIIVRLPEQEMLRAGTRCMLATGELEYFTPVEYWGALWGSHWWIATFGQSVKEAVYRVEIREGEEVLLADGGLEVKRNILWNRTIRLSSVDMLERRVHFTKVGAGWQDAGTLWVESCAQSGMIIGLEDLLEYDPNRFDREMIQRLEKQIIVGCDYLVMTQQKAAELGYPEGAFSHDLHGHENDILPNDANKAVVALFRASRLLSGKFAIRKTRYREAGEKAFQWLVRSAGPLGDYGFQVFQRAIPEDTVIPDDEWVTRDLVMMCWASLERWKLAKDEESKQWCHHYAQKIMERQIPEDSSEQGFYGHFYEFTSLNHSESAWIHGIVPSETGAQFGTDLGGFFPNYLIPVIEMVKLWPDHPDAVQWKKMLADFSNGYLKPVCQANPFYLVPLGIFGEEGPNWFCGTFHGTNAIYGFTAALALELSSLLEDEELIRIAYGNLQWIAGLNGGVTRENLRKGCVVFSMDIEENLALPASMICHIGNRWAGTWFQTRGVICNGFSVGEQFRYDVPVQRANDGPHSFTDEDWIPHSAGWVAGLVRLNRITDQLKASTI
jgi:hypothetical protein